MPGGDTSIVYLIWEIKYMAEHADNSKIYHTLYLKNQMLVH